MAIYHLSIAAAAAAAAAAATAAAANKRIPEQQCSWAKNGKKLSQEPTGEKNDRERNYQWSEVGTEMTKRFETQQPRTNFEHRL